MGAIGMMAFNEVMFRCVCISERRVGQPGTGHCRELGELGMLRDENRGSTIAHLMCTFCHS